LNEETLTRVLRKVRGVLPGRFEVRELGGVPVVVDGGHNPAGVRAAVAAVRSVYGERPLWVVFGALRGKDIASMLTALTREAERLLLTCAENERALDPEYVLSEHEPRDRGGRRARVMQDADIALSVAADEARLRDGVVLVTGSLYLGARVLGRLREE
jgi:dihydrofolate synthase/folylpolyglutamate synthase